MVLPNRMVLRRVCAIAVWRIALQICVSKYDCALPAQYTKHSNARGVSLGLKSRLDKAHLGSSTL